jgi:hypothetical protein
MSNTISLKGPYLHISRDTTVLELCDNARTLHSSAHMSETTMLRYGGDSDNPLLESCCRARATTVLRLCHKQNYLDMHHEIERIA